VLKRSGCCLLRLGRRVSRLDVALCSSSGLVFPFSCLRFHGFARFAHNHLIKEILEGFGRQGGRMAFPGFPALKRVQFNGQASIGKDFDGLCSREIVLFAPALEADNDRRRSRWGWGYRWFFSKESLDRKSSDGLGGTPADLPLLKGAEFDGQASSSKGTNSFGLAETASGSPFFYSLDRGLSGLLDHQVPYNGEPEPRWQSIGARKFLVEPLSISVVCQ